jgi:hypothetical protein
MCGFFRKVGLAAFFLTLLSIARSQAVSRGGQTLYWTKNYRLTFADFQGKPEQKDSALYAANDQTAIHRLGTITKSIDVQFRTTRGKTSFIIYAGMKKKLSWIKNDGDTITLQHEQGHFDICEIYARILRREIRKAKSLAEAKRMFDRISDDEEVEHDQFDQENTFQSGGITSDWKAKINDRLKNLELYKNPVVVLSIYK